MGGDEISLVLALTSFECQHLYEFHLRLTEALRRNSEWQRQLR